MKPPLLTFAFLLALLHPVAAAESVPANPDANTRVTEVLAFLQGLEVREGGKVLSGQFVGYANLGGAELPAALKKATGFTPALLGADYADYGHQGLSAAAQNRVLLEHWKNGGLVSVSVHLYNPCRPKGEYGLRDKDVVLDELLKSGTPAHRRWMQQLDEIASGLQELKNAGVVVLWRPFHEMNGAWFWWGAKDASAFIRLWRHMFEYFSKEKHLDNLLWVYAPNHGQHLLDYYPGDAFVDIVGVDSYPEEVTPAGVPGAQELAKFPKPFAFTEFGPAHHSPLFGRFDYLKFSTGLKQYFPRAVFFLCWDEGWNPLANKHGKEFYQDPRFLHLEHLQALSGKDGLGAR